MKYLSFTFLFFILSCSNSFRQSLISKGYDVSKDTIIIKPYEYFIKYPGYGIQYKEIHPSKMATVEIGIKGFERSRSIPIAVLKDTFELYISDSSIRNIVSGELIYKFRGGAGMFYPKGVDIDSLKVSYNPLIKRFRRFEGAHFLLFFNFVVEKGHDTIVIPSRKYDIEY